MSKELDEFYKSYSARLIAVDDTPLVEVMDGGKFKLLSIEEYEEMANKIADLEAKLAECEKQIKDARETANMSVDSWCKNRRKYEAQIAEMQNKSFILYSMLYETLEKQGCDNVASQIDQMTGWTYDKEADWLKGNRNYDQLKQQLSEKEKELEQTKKSYARIELNELLNETCQRGVSDWTAWVYCIKRRIKNIETRDYNQDKISFALGLLEKVSQEFSMRVGITDNNMDLLNEIIDNQIKAIKGE